MDVSVAENSILLIPTDNCECCKLWNTVLMTVQHKLNKEKEQMTSWAKRGAAALAATPTTKRDAGERGERFEAVIDKVEAKTFNKSLKNPNGSFGFTLKLAVKGVQFPVYDHIILASLDGKGGYIDTQYGRSTLAKRLAAAGLTSDQVLALGEQAPLNSIANDKTIAALTGANVVAYLINETYAGKDGSARETKRVKAMVFPNEG